MDQDLFFHQWIHSHLSQGSLNRSLRATEPAFVALGRVGSMASNEHTRPLQNIGECLKRATKTIGMAGFFASKKLHLISENVKCSDKAI